MRKIGFLTLLISASLLFAITFPASAALPPRHPHVHEGIEAMRNAKHHLETAVGDFHGHRARAIEHLDQAIHEAEICEQES
jgi:hypothetical protein